MTDLAKKIADMMAGGVSDPVEILAAGLGASEYEVEFIMTQIKIANGE